MVLVMVLVMVILGAFQQMAAQLPGCITPCTLSIATLPPIPVSLFSSNSLTPQSHHQQQQAQRGYAVAAPACHWAEGKIAG
mmetsp:Transcript_13051/g.36715  ORF Transcript_13051/g.36715 Transcript_13051/m.36715 type:complete len:81 (-) Transcript_13051:7-249(-)